MKKNELGTQADPTVVGKEICRVISNHRSAYHDPLVIRAGEELSIDEKRSSRSGWIWCMNQKAQSGWVPEKYVERKGKTCLALCSYEATELSVRVGEVLMVGKEENGWLWCTNREGQNGWVPEEKIEKLSNARYLHEHREPGCAFCNMKKDHIIRENGLAYAIRDKFPVTPLHTLIIPKRHVSSYFDLDRSQIDACHQLLAEIRDEIVSSDSDVKGFNIGINQGVAAGQTVLHCHIHLIPRREGDVQNPRGGIRHLIPGKGCYQMGSQRW